MDAAPTIATRPSQDRIATARAKLECIRGQSLDDTAFQEKRRAIFDGAKIPGTIAMVEGGARKPVQLLIETENGWLVSVTMTVGEARHLGELLLASAGDR